ncbi:MAG: hypothetical protein O3C69_04015 [Chloroflexi bacterium]|nr:hypothetical protein [Chloroflexota bacterium]
MTKFIKLKRPRGDHWLNLSFVSLVAIDAEKVYVYFGTDGDDDAAVEMTIADAGPLLAALTEAQE